MALAAMAVMAVGAFSSVDILARKALSYSAIVVSSSLAELHPRTYPSSLLYYIEFKAG